MGPRKGVPQKKQRTQHSSSEISSDCFGERNKKQTKVKDNASVKQSRRQNTNTLAGKNIETKMSINSNNSVCVCVCSPLSVFTCF